MEQIVLRGAFALRNVRVWFNKKDSAKYISHLDLNRCMARVVKRAKLPIWYTEGFNPHPFITFSLPLSLGIQGENESMDIKLTDDLENSEIERRFNLCLPVGIKVLKVTDQIMKPKEISYALFEIDFISESIKPEEFKSILERFINRDNITTEKKTKSGAKIIDLKEEIKKFEIKLEDKIVKLFLTLPAGNEKNINPLLFVNEFRMFETSSFCCDIIRLNVYNKKFEVFK